jgi:hypothetical protein
MKWEDTRSIVAELTSLRHFPTQPAGQIAVMKLVGAMASDIKQVRWLVDRMHFLFNEWPGPRTMRIVFCSKFKPQDGIDISGPCEQFPDGIPSENPRLEAPSYPQLAAGTIGPVSENKRLDMAVQRAGAAKSLNALPEAYPVTRAQRIRDKEFQQTLKQLETAPVDREPEPPIVRKPNASAIISANERGVLPPAEPLPPGSYTPITKDQMEELYRKHKEELKRKAEGDSKP